MDLELVEQEASVGNFSLDILAKDLSSGHNVVIENQFGDTNHDHLGKLLTYAAGFDAHKVIWISENVRDEHRQTIEWLNQRTDVDTQFFAIEIEVFKIDDSKPAFNFKLVSFPNDWSKNKQGNAKSVPSVKGESYRVFFQSLVDELRTKYDFTKAKVAMAQNWFSFPSGISGLIYAVNFAQGDRVRVELYIDRGDSETNKNIFDWLYEQKDAIESEIGSPLEWEKLDERRASRVALYREGSITNADQLEEIRAWSIRELLKFKKVFTPRLKTSKEKFGY